MRRAIVGFILLLLFCSLLAGQNQLTITIGTQKFTFTIPTFILSLKCDKTALSMGDSSTCTINLNLPAPSGGFSVTPYTADPPLVLQPATLVVPPGTTSATFTVTYPTVTAGRMDQRIAALLAAR